MRILDEDLVEVLDRAHRRSTVSIVLGDDSELHLSTGAFSFDSIDYEGVLAPVDALNLEGTEADEGVEFRISNISGEIGEDLINNVDNKLDGTNAVLGCFFRDGDDEWHDVKLPGFIETGEIDQNWVSIFFQSLGAKKWVGKTIVELFPEEEIPAEEIPQIPPQIPVNFLPFSVKYPLLNENDPFDGIGRNFLPAFEFKGDY